VPSASGCRGKSSRARVRRRCGSPSIRSHARVRTHSSQQNPARLQCGRSSWRSIPTWSAMQSHPVQEPSQNGPRCRTSHKSAVATLQTGVLCLCKHLSVSRRIRHRPCSFTQCVRAKHIRRIRPLLARRRAIVKQAPLSPAGGARGEAREVSYDGQGEVAPRPIGLSVTTLGR